MWPVVVWHDVMSPAGIHRILQIHFSEWIHSHLLLYHELYNLYSCRRYGVAPLYSRWKLKFTSQQSLFSSVAWPLSWLWQWPLRATAVVLAHPVAKAMLPSMLALMGALQIPRRCCGEASQRRWRCSETSWNSSWSRNWFVLSFFCICLSPFIFHPYKNE